jgi:hypothetical protein
MQTSNPDELRLLGFICGDREKEFHDRFLGYRKRGEWFSIGPRFLDFLREKFGWQGQAT